MARKRFRYFLKADPSTYYYVANGTVQTTPTPTPLEDDPIEWASVERRWTRNEVADGIVETFVIALTMTKDGARILRNIFLAQGKEGVCQIVVEEKNLTDELYHSFYEGDVDFSESISTNNGFQVQVVDNGLEAKIKAKATTPYALAMLDATCQRVYMDGVRLRQRSVFAVSSIMSASGLYGAQVSPQLDHELSEAPYLQDIKQSRPAVTGSPASMAASNFVYTASYPGTARFWFSGNIVVNSASPAVLGVHFEVVAFWNGSSQNSFTIYSGATVSSSTVGYVESVPRQYIDVLMQPGETLTLIYGMRPFATPSGAGNYYFDCTDGKLEIEYFIRRAPLIVRGKRQFQVWQELVSAISDGANTAVSDYLTNPTALNFGNNPWNTLLTCGDSARGLGNGSGAAGTVPAKMKLSLNDMRADAQGRDMLGIGVERDSSGKEVLRIEPKGYFYNNSKTTLRLGEVKDFRWSYNKDRSFNLLKIGYRNTGSGNDTLNGKDDPHTTWVWSTFGVRAAKDLDLTSPFTASMYQFEYIRANLAEKQTTNDAGDNDILLIEIDKATPFGFYLLARRQNLPGNSVSGLVAGDTAFNLGLLATLNLYRNGAALHGGLHLMDNTLIKLQKADQNEEVAAALDSNGVIVEKANIPVQALASPYTLPIDFQFSYPISLDARDALHKDPYARIEFMWRNPTTGLLVPMAGFIDDAVAKVTSEGSWKLMATPDTSMTALNF